MSRRYSPPSLIYIHSPIFIIPSFSPLIEMVPDWRLDLSMRLQGSGQLTKPRGVVGCYTHSGYVVGLADGYLPFFLHPYYPISFRILLI